MMAQGNLRDQPCATDWDHRDIHIWGVLHNLYADRPGTCQDRVIVVAVDVGQEAFVAGHGLGICLQFAYVIVLDDDICTKLATPIHLEQRYHPRHDHRD
eukprot:CAMPEP_0201197298 /NCGR_PEP_ID=MMETSP0851-20130426/154494_1 /ASSEMBLY_ACC=CAM_ASM_000631 /TAXON_ID=183588 /ORGANISM="Pseudo-nitzschia fraudulenta, Strain WWA7" /LENGTH=98 /DNA_ID=CAMNT_0047484373 /DNA_START=323 /DNA_END=619 /DNA_ORIENTATION=+